MFKKTGDRLYLMDESEVRILEADILNMISSISGVDINYSVSITSNLYATMLSRAVATKFITEHKDVLDRIPNVVVHVKNSDGSTYAITVGGYVIDNSGINYLHGVLQR